MRDAVCSWTLVQMQKDVFWHFLGSGQLLPNFPGVPPSKRSGPIVQELILRRPDPIGGHSHEWGHLVRIAHRLCRAEWRSEWRVEALLTANPIRPTWGFLGGCLGHGTGACGLNGTTSASTFFFAVFWGVFVRFFFQQLALLGARGVFPWCSTAVDSCRFPVPSS